MRWDYRFLWSVPPSCIQVPKPTNFATTTVLTRRYVGEDGLEHKLGWGNLPCQGWQQEEDGLTGGRGVLSVRELRVGEPQGTQQTVHRLLILHNWKHGAVDNT